MLSSVGKKSYEKLGEKKEKIDLEEKKNDLKERKSDLKERFIRTVSNEDHLCPQIERY